ncbi:MAG: hypothetical protein IKR76_07425 [Ruminococcus sp.]|nr:hypothetical protein [Ruminococcus sp.]
MKRKILCLFSAVLFLCLCSCSGKSDSTFSIVIGENNINDFTYGNSFFIPPTPEAYEYSFRYDSIGEDKLRLLVDEAFGNGTFERGTVAEPDENADGYDWRIDESKLVWLSTNGYYAVQDFDLSYDTYYPDIELDEETNCLSYSLVFENRFTDTEVTFGSRSYTLEQLSDTAFEKLYSFSNAIDSTAELYPICALYYTDANGKGVYADIIFCRKLGDSRFRFLFADELFSDGQWSEGIPSTAYIVSLYGEDKVFSVYGGNEFTDLKQTQQLKIINCSDAINKAAESLGNKAKHITLNYAQLEYSAVHIDTTSGIMTALPYWALYYTNDDGSNGVICVEAQTGEVKPAKLFT